MCRYLYTVLLATVLSLACTRSFAQGPGAPQSPAEQEQVLLLQQRSTVNLQLRDEQQAHDRYSVVGPMVVGAIGVTTFVVGGFVASMAYLLRGIGEYEGGYSAEEKARVHGFLYMASAGAAVIVGAAGWLTYEIRHRRVHSRAIKELTLQRHQVDARLLQLNQQRAPSPNLTIAPLLSPNVQGLSLSLTF